jgi:hypothetical protein
MMCHQLSPVLPATGNPAQARGRRRSRPNTSWITAGIGLVIVLVSVVLMAVSAPARPAAPVRPAPAPHGLIHLERDAGPIPAPVSGTGHRPAR